MLIFVAVIGIGAWASRNALIGRVEREVIARLAEEGIHLRYERRTWSPWDGLRLENVVLRRAAQDDRPVVALTALEIGVPLKDAFRTRSVISVWRVKDATLTLHDDAGPISFTHVTTRLVSRPGHYEISDLQARHGALALALSGRVSIPVRADSPPPAGPFLLDLTTVRNVLSVLAFKPEAGVFTIRGDWSVELRDRQDPVWQARLAGLGEGVQWQGVPLRRALVEGRVSSEGLDLTSDLQFTDGSAKVSAARKDWETAPLAFSGSLTDAHGSSDEFSGRYERLTQTVTVNRLEGQADLVAFGRNFPALVPHLPASISIQKFPALAVKDLTWSVAPDSVNAWSVNSVEIRSPATFSVLMGGLPLRVELEEGLASYTEGTWKTEIKTGPLSWRDLRASHARIDATVTGETVKSQVEVKLPNGSADLTISTDDYRRAPVEISGALADSRGRASRFAATYHQAPARWQVARLDGKADLLELAANFPGVPARLPATVKLRSEFPEIAVRDFSYRSGQTPTFGSLRLVSPADVTVTVRGHAVPIDRLSGQVASAGRAWKFSRVSGRVFGGQATVDGIYEKAVFRDVTLAASNLRVAQFKPWLGDSQASLGQAVLALDYRGTLAGMDNAARITGSGRVRLENAPVVKIPLLDQTYALFSILSSPIQRRGSGSLEATFSADKGVVSVSQFAARSDSARVTASGTIDLKKREVQGRARGNIRGVFGLATTPLSRALEMQVSGPLHQIRVRPVGFKGILSGVANILPDTVKKSSRITSDIVRNGIALPLRALEIFTPDEPKGSSKR